MALGVVLAAVGLGVCVLAGVVIGVGVALGAGRGRVALGVGFGLVLGANRRGVGWSRLGLRRLGLVRLRGLGLLVGVLLSSLGLLVCVRLRLLFALRLLVIGGRSGGGRGIGRLDLGLLGRIRLGRARLVIGVSSQHRRLGHLCGLGRLTAARGHGGGAPHVSRRGRGPRPGA